jgi:hypothetical protein
MACVSAVLHAAVIAMPVAFHVRRPTLIEVSWLLVRLPCIVAVRCLALCCRKIRLAGGLLPWSWVNYVNSERGFLDLVRRSTRLGADPVAIIKSYEANPAGEAWPRLCVCWKQESALRLPMGPFPFGSARLRWLICVSPTLQVALSWPCLPTSVWARWLWSTRTIPTYVLVCSEGFVGGG